MHYVYIIKSTKDNKLYTGATDNLQNRLNQHSNGLVTSTKNRDPFKLIYYEACENQQDSYAREKYLKSSMGKRYIKNRLKRFLTLTG